MAGNQPNIVFFFWDNFAWGELGCYGGGVLRGAPTPRIDALAREGLQLLNHNVEAQCTPSRSALLPGRHAIRSGTQTVPIAGGPDGMTRWEVTIAKGAVGRRLRHRDVGEVAPSARSSSKQRSPRRLRVRRGRCGARQADEVL